MPLLPERAHQKEWDAWFDWYYAQSWGYVPDKVAHMASLCGKAKNTIEKGHAVYTADKRPLS